MAGYKSPFAGTPGMKKAEKLKEKSKSKKKSSFWKLGERQGDAAADHLLDMHDKKKKK